MFFRMKHKYIARQDRTPGYLNSSNKNQFKHIFNKPNLSAI